MTEKEFQTVVVLSFHVVIFLDLPKNETCGGYIYFADIARVLLFSLVSFFLYYRVVFNVKEERRRNKPCICG